MIQKLKLIADRANVSISTVSRVINNKPNTSKKTRDGVVAAMRYLGFQPPAWVHDEASEFIGLLTSPSECRQGLQFRPPVDVDQQLLQSLAAHRYLPVLCLLQGPSKNNAAFENLLRTNVRQILLVVNEATDENYLQDYINSIEKSLMRVVVIDLSLEHTTRNIEVAVSREMYFMEHTFYEDVLEQLMRY